MTTQKKNILTLSALALLLTLAPLSQATAKVVVRASVGTPHYAVKVNTSPVKYKYRQGKHRVVVKQKHVRLTKQDRKMAKRLARVSYYSKREILELRRDGYSWKRIGRLLNLDPRAVRAARHAVSWNRYLDFGRPTVVRCGTHY
jgi:hypothetical protein